MEVALVWSRVGEPAGRGSRGATARKGGLGLVGCRVCVILFRLRTVGTLVFASNYQLFSVCYLVTWFRAFVGFTVTRCEYVLITGISPVTSSYFSYVLVILCLQLLYSDFARVFSRCLVFGTCCGRGLANKECLFPSPYPNYVAISHITVSLRTCWRTAFFRVCYVPVISRSLFVA